MEPIFRVWDCKYKKWAGLRGEKGRTFDQYWREKLFKTSGLMWCDLDGFSLTEEGSLILNDECGGQMYLDQNRFQVCFEKEKFAALADSESGSYKVLQPK